MISIAKTPKDAVRELANRYDVKLSTESFNILTSMMHSERYRHRTMIMEPGETCSTLFFITKGLIRIYNVNAEADELTCEILHENDVFLLEQCLFSGMPSDFHVQTLEPTTLYGIDFPTLRTLADIHPDINQLLYNILTQDILQKNDYLNTLYLHPKDRYSHLLETNSEVVRRTPLKYIASYLRMAPETLSRVRNTMLI
ncbi:MAG: Crp/Fnr family transcriptional regulator [Bacteroidaceae bacterium]|nr:Crp/Fnr family transcriptional regulator [Bacteroidaceae bacterium]MBQ9175696.1 Crp/Fnr family transcriptional regulator [Bacteroidaceae bacterium]MBR1378927.1 Crp/Fnr family transcriptional regulator [Bacteroidaceae bacterium]